MGVGGTAPFLRKSKVCGKNHITEQWNSHSVFRFPFHCTKTTT